MMGNTLKGFIVFILFCSLSFGCGYKIRPAGKTEGVSLQEIAIPLFSSSSSFMGTEEEFTRAVREEFIRHSSVRIEDRKQARFFLRANIYSLTTEPLAYRIEEKTIHGYKSKEVTTRTRRLTVKMDVELLDQKKGEAVWHDPALEGKSNFAVSADPLKTRYNRRRAIANIARNLAAQIYRRTMERF